VRTIAVVKGRILIASLLGFVEVLIWVIAVSNVVNSLDRPLNLIAWAAGFAVGNAVGSPSSASWPWATWSCASSAAGEGATIAEKLRNLGQPVTEFEGKGRSGPVQLLYIVMDRVDGDRVERIARTVDPDWRGGERGRPPRQHEAAAMMTPRTDWRSVLKRK